MLGELESSAAAAHIPESVIASVMSSNVTDLPGAADDADEAIHERALEASIFGERGEEMLAVERAEEATVEGGKVEVEVEAAMEEGLGRGSWERELGEGVEGI